MKHQANNVIELPHALGANHFLSALDGISRSELAPHLMLSNLKTGQVLCDAGEDLEAVYFPVTAGISLQYTAGGKMTLGVTEIGREGLVCDDVIGSAMQRRVVVYRGGFAYRLYVRRFASVCDASAAIRRQIFVRMQLVLSQASQVMFCSRHHVMRHQLSRWLLIAYERSRSIEIPVTHGMLGQMLGVRRETVTDTTRQLHELGVIHQHRGAIVLTDLAGLERQGCDCHRVIRDETRRILAIDDGTGGGVELSRRVWTT
ncbi:Crp/Fnr family transcriptional regulator [Burkholderia territorii]|uniref:Crp/Fnr family transcriptional regulator n=1 Tax=Burkholderia territorii TaxID=1503055 RepID=UPI00075CEC69|nr:Crp/Fnr family transcriptional regulator [Burkholderia territorii]KVL34721.1 Crp/Fnr family transcriptional regulator [Burkholderia territorii]KVL37051.1 Crp/Fnr family transcriptional regulator [Burkholderia territorii]KVL59608.1 Crp/Fnr family transcriptional regulator [Burkholderia territorii]KVN45753.1 Crp/Fnr family transcriptional regulator [Burkholderia territorii]KVQ40276.1 Crp/Fnr family transcriptional regulator [Burkholderia territorii]